MRLSPLLILIIAFIGLIVYLLVRSSKKTRKDFDAYQQTIHNQPESSQSGYVPKHTFAQDAPSTGFAVLGFFFPFIGLIMYIAWLNTLPFRARSAGKGAIGGMIVYIIASVITILVTVL